MPSCLKKSSALLQAARLHQPVLDTVELIGEDRSEERSSGMLWRCMYHLL
jgi:hypothetical protein